VHARHQRGQAVALAGEGRRPVAHLAAMGAEDAPGRQRTDAVQGRDEGFQVLVLAQVAQPLGQEEVAGEEPAALALEEADMVRAVPRRGHHFEPQPARGDGVAKGARLHVGRPAPGQAAIAFLHEPAREQGQGRRRGLHFDAARSSAAAPMWSS